MVYMVYMYIYAYAPAELFKCLISDMFSPHPGVELREDLKSISHICYLLEVKYVWELTKETIHLPLGCLQGGSPSCPTPVPLKQAHAFRLGGQASRSLDSVRSHVETLMIYDLI